MNSSGTWALSDRMNTTTTDSANALDFSTQYQSAVVYEQNLQDLYDNAHSELKDLQFKARERAPYNTNLCTLKPMYPTWNAAQPCYPQSCDLNMHPVCQGGTACNVPNTFYAGVTRQAPLCPNEPADPFSRPTEVGGFFPRTPALECHYREQDGDSETSDADEEIIIVNQLADPGPPGDVTKKIKPVERMSRNMMRALMGVAYDLNHWNQLPPQKNRLSTGKTFKYVLGRDNRPLYIVMLVAFFVFIVAIVVGISCFAKKMHHRNKRNRILKDLKEQAYLQYQLQGLQGFQGSPFANLSKPPYYSSAPAAPLPVGLSGGLRKW
jgi:hypothetical protein